MATVATSAVFRPSDGDLVVRGSLSQGPDLPTDMFRKDAGKRPATQGGYRFGQLSRNSFFTRHNPQPARVRHFKGLLDVPICSVNDEGYFANPRYSLQFPPNQHDNNLLRDWKGRIPVHTMNVNSQCHPINMITGLQYFTGLNIHPFRKKAIPRIGLVPETEAWRDELQEFTKTLASNGENNGLVPDAPSGPKPDAPSDPKPDDDSRPRSTKYSTETGRIIPPPSRAGSRGGSMRGSLNQQVLGNMQHFAAEPDMENVVLVMLCQILQTEDVNSVHAWLCSAGEREKERVRGLVRSAMVGREEYYKQYPIEFISDNENGKLPPINRLSLTSGETNRLVLDDSTEATGNTWQKVWIPPTDAIAENTGKDGKNEDQCCSMEKEKQVIEDNMNNTALGIEPPTNEVFEPVPPCTKKPTTPLIPARVSTTPKQEKPATSSQHEARRLKSPAHERTDTALWSQICSMNTF